MVLSVLGYEYRVEFVDEIKDSDSSHGHDDVADLRTLGEIDYITQTIYISRNQHAQSMSATLAHEILHAILWINGYKEHDEDLIDRIAYGLGFAFMHMIKEQT